jgi:ABC-type amino acid transport substrate-binding protein
MIKKILFLFILIFSISSCSNIEIDKNEIICIVSGKIPPFSYYENYDLVGFEIDLVKIIGKKLNKKIIFDNLPAMQIIQNLEQGYADIAISNFVITKERQKNFYMVPYHKEEIVFLYNKNFHNFTSIKDINLAKLNISSLYGMFNKEFIEWTKKNFENNKIVYFFNEILTIYALNQNIICGVLMTKNEAENLKKINNAKYEYIKMDDLIFNFGIIIKKDNKKLYSKISYAVQELYQTQEIERLKKIYNIL